MQRITTSLILAVVLGSNSLTSATLPNGFKVTKFAGFPQVTYPTGVAAAPTGEVYVCIDRNSSLDTEANRGKIVRCVDTDNDGVADRFNDYVADIDSPRGSCFVDGTLYVVNPPFLTAFRDRDGDGVADEKRILVKGLGFDLSFRGADHTSNGVRMGVDGWLYLAIGDYGFMKAEGIDGQAIHLHGGGVVRVRPDGSELEHYSRYLRNIYDVAVGPKLDLFARDNTNDGKGWNTRLHHIVALADHGYPRLYKNFPNEHIQPMADYGGGSGTGAYWLDEPGFPSEFNNKLYTCDFTTRKVYLHDLEPQEATFKASQSVFYDIQAIDMDCDGFSRIYVSDWTGGRYRFENEEVGSITRITYPGLAANKFPDLKRAGIKTLVNHFRSASAVVRLNASRELIRRGAGEATSFELSNLIGDPKAPLSGRIVALFALKQVNRAKADARLVSAAKDATIREWAIRALTDRKSAQSTITAPVLVRYLQDPNPRVQLQAAIGLTRLGHRNSTRALLAKVPDPDAGFSSKNNVSEKYAANQILPHVAIQSVVDLGSVSECLQALRETALRPAALRALQKMHSTEAVAGLIDELDQASASETEYQLALLKTLFRLYHREKPWDGKKWWTTRPDDRGPYFDPIEWEQTPAIRMAIEKAINAIAETHHSSLLYEMRRNRIDPTKLELNVKVDEILAILQTPAPSSTAIPLLQDAAIDMDRDIHTRAAAFSALGRIPGIVAFRAQIAAMAAWHENEPNNASLQGITRDFVFSPTHVNRPKILRDNLKKPKGYGGQVTIMAALNLVNSPIGSDYLQNLLNPFIAKRYESLEFVEAVGELLLNKYLPQVETAAASPNAQLSKAARRVAKRLRKLSQLTPEQMQTVEELGVKKAIQLAMKTGGDVSLGRQIFARQSCLACHTVSMEAEQKGPYLGDAGNKWQRDYLVQAILEPSAVVAQGFQTQWFDTKDDFSYDGFVTAEADGVIEIRNAVGQLVQIKESDIAERGTRTTSMMPEGLANNLSIFELASLLDYMQSLH